MFVYTFDSGVNFLRRKFFAGTVFHENLFSGSSKNPQKLEPAIRKGLFTQAIFVARRNAILSRWSCNFNIARVNQLRFQRDFSAIYRAITCDLSPRFTKHGNFEQQFRYSAGAHVLFWFDFFFILFRFASISFCFDSILFCFVLQLGKDLEVNWSDWTGVTPIFIPKKKETI